MLGNNEKTVNKSKVFAKHGKHKPILGVLVREEREKIQRPKEPMYATVHEAFEASKSKKGGKANARRNQKL